jgi:hypothetical protein
MQAATAHQQAVLNRRLQEEFAPTANGVSKEITASAPIATRECGSNIFIIYKIIEQMKGAGDSTLALDFFG